MAAPPSVAAAYAACERLAREHYENFPVASRLLPRRVRPHIAAIYAFARTADDYADEPGMADDERLRRLDDWERRLDRAAAGETNGDPVFDALAHTIAHCELPVELLRDLLSAFRQDVTVHRYDTWSGVFDYCRRSANPVGRLVLRVAGYRDPRLDASSDALCTALQLANFWQDFGRDWANGRLYLPREEAARAGARESDLEAGRFTPAWRDALRHAAALTRERFDAGRLVCDGVGGRLRWELRLTWLGGARILEKVGRPGADPLAERPTLGARDVPLLLARAIAWRRTPRLESPRPA